MDLFELFKLSRTLRMKDGTILLMDTPVNIIPTDILCDLQKGLIDSVGVSQAYKLFYESAKNGAIDYNKEYMEIVIFQLILFQQVFQQAGFQQHSIKTLKH